MPKPKTAIKNYIIASFTLFIFATFGVSGYYVFSSWKASAEKTIHLIREDTGKQIFYQIDDFIRLPMNLGRASHLLIQENIVDFHDKRKREIFFANLVKLTNKEIYSISYGNENGEYFGARHNSANEIEVYENNPATNGNTRYYKTTPDLLAGELVLETDQFDPRTRDWYQQAKTLLVPSYSPIYRHFVLDDLALSASYPIFDRNQALMGVMGIHVALSGLNERLNSIVAGNAGMAFIVESDTGLLVANSQEKPNFRLVNGTIVRNTISEVAEGEIVDAYQMHKQHLLTESVNRKEYSIQLMNYTKPGINWIVVVAIPKTIFMSDLITSIYFSAFFTVILIFIAVFLYKKSAEVVLEPVESLTHIAEKYARGDFSERAKIFRNDEIGTLSDVFNKMADQIHMLIHSLENKVLERTIELRDAVEKLTLSQRMLEETNEALIESNRNLEIHVRTDGLTGLNNRRYMNEKINEEFARFLRHGTVFSLVIADIDFFKKINDTHGHPTGDGILKFVAEDFLKAIRACDFVARWGGEEFLFLLPGTELAQAIVFSERIRKILAETSYNINNIKLNITLTFGVSAIQPGETAETVLKRADDALYEGKLTGRNCVVAK